MQQNYTMPYKIIFLSLISIFVLSCKQSSSGPVSEVEALHNEIMAVHDAVMPKTSDIHKQIKKLKKLKKDIPENNTSFIKMIDTVIKDLDDADEKMMLWMKQYKKPDFKNKSVEQMNDLNTFRDRIEVVKNNINSSLEKASQLEERFKVLEDFKKK